MPTMTCSSLEEIYAENERRGIEAARKRKADNAARIEAKLARTVPEAYRDAAVTDLGCRAWLGGYLAGERRNLVLSGGNGTGKTTQAYAICAELMRKGVNCTFGTAGTLMRHVRRAYDGDFTEEEAIDALAGVPVLFVDDLGKESPTDWAIERLFEVLDARAAARKPVVITTNLTSAQLRKRYQEAGQAIISRLMGGALGVHFGGADWRIANG